MHKLFPYNYYHKFGSTSAETLPPQPLHVLRLLPLPLPVWQFTCRGYPTKRAGIGEPHDVTPSRRAQPCLWRHLLLHVHSLEKLRNGR